MLSVGVDIVENKRIEKSINDSFLNIVLSKEEIEIYKKYTDNRAIEFVSGRWALKEAIIKCLADYEVPMMNKLVILNKENGKPYIEYKNYKIAVSLSHENNYSIGFAVLEEIGK